MVFSTAGALEDSIRAGAPLPVYLLYGEEGGRTQRYASRLAALCAPEETYAYDGRALPGMDAVADCALSLSFSGKRRCVLIDDLDCAALPSPDWDKLCELLEAPEPNTLLLVTSRTTGLGDRKEKGAAATRGKKLIELCGKAGGVCRFDRLTQADAARAAGAAAARAGRVLEKEDAMLLAEDCGCDLTRIGNEIAKLLAYRQEGRITRGDIELLVPPAVEANVFRLSGLILARDFGGAMELIDDLIFLREQPAAILSMVSMAFADLYKAASAQRAGKTMQESARAYGMAGYRYEKAWANAKQIQPPRLARALEILAEGEAAVKAGGADARIALETAVALLTVQQR